ncbi:hypothetical protein A2U01_0078748, partial [Trifolium medium]|nr:hypothetical protein [Trifolium medium]
MIEVRTGSGGSSGMEVRDRGMPEHIQHFHLKKAFEVCGMLENVHVASKRNVKGC